MLDQSPISRRQILGAGAGFAAAGLTAGCRSSEPSSGAESTATGRSPSAPTAGASGSSSASSGQTTSGGPGGSVLPSYIPFTGVKPDIPAASEYALAGFYQYPTPAVAASADTPGTGGTVTVAVDAHAPIPKSAGSNAWWKALNARLGVDLNLQMTPSAQYAAKIATIISGNDLPDMMRLSPLPPRLGQLLAARFANLNEYLSGDNVKQYPSLASIPTETWKSTVYNGAIYGVSMPLLLISPRMVARRDLLDTLKVEPKADSAEEFLELCKAVTDDKQSRWAMGEPTVTGYIAEMVGVPNDWRVDGGKFVKDIETDEYAQALDFVKKMWDAGYFYPDSFSGATPLNQLLRGRRICMMNAGGTGVVTTYANALAVDKDYRMAFLPAPQFDGGGLARKQLSSGEFGLTVINKDLPKEKIQEMLRILDLLAAPFGTKEYLLVHYGAEGADYTIDEKTGAITNTKTGISEKLPVNYLPGAPNTYSSPGHDDVVKAICEYEAAVSAKVEPLPTVGLASETGQTKAPLLTKALVSASSDIVQGRKPLSAWKDAVTAWRKAGGDDIRSEYEKSYADANS